MIMMVRMILGDEEEEGEENSSKIEFDNFIAPALFSAQCWARDYYSDILTYYIYINN